MLATDLTVVARGRTQSVLCERLVVEIVRIRR